MTLPSKYKQIILQNPPLKDVHVELGSPKSTFALQEVDFPQLKDDQVVVKVSYLLNDPTQRSWIQLGNDPKRMYTAPVLKGEPMKSLGLGEVIASKNDKYKTGDTVVGMFGWKDYSVVNAFDIFNKVAPLAGIPLSYYLSALGMTGMTAFIGTLKIGQLKKGQSIVVSAALGATGSLVVQIAKHIVGAERVIGLAGTAEKCRWVESIGADHCINYNDPSYRKQFSKLIGDNFVDVYFDNVGGEILDLALTKVKPFGRVVACGAVAGYNDYEKLFVKQWGQIITNRLVVQGFIITDHVKEYPEAVKALAEGLKLGKISPEVASVVDVKGDWTQVPVVWSRLFGGKGPGKLLTKL